MTVNFLLWLGLVLRWFASICQMIRFAPIVIMRLFLSAISTRIKDLAKRWGRNASHFTAMRLVTCSIKEQSVFNKTWNLVERIIHAHFALVTQNSAENVKSFKSRLSYFQCQMGNEIVKTENNKNLEWNHSQKFASQ